MKHMTMSKKFLIAALVALLALSTCGAALAEGEVYGHITGSNQIVTIGGVTPVVLGSGTAADTGAFTADVSLLEDGSFETVGKEGFKDYTSAWDFYWFPPLSNGGTMESQAEYVIHDAENAHTGEYYLMNDKVGWFGIAEPTVELAAGDYLISIWVRAEEGYCRVNFTVDEGPVGSVLETDATMQIIVDEGAPWQQVSCRFTITEPGTYRVRVGMNSNGQEVVEYWFDDFELFYLGQNMFEDGSFETVGKEGFKDYTSTWDFYWFPPLSNGGTMESQAEYVINDHAAAHDGEYYLMNDKTGWFGIAEPSIYLEAGDYEFSVWTRSEEGKLRVNFTVDESPVGCLVETDQLGTSVELPEGGDWALLRTRFTVETEGNYRVRVGMNSIGQEVVEYNFDDFRLVKLTKAE